MRRAIDLAIKAVVAFGFVVCVECFSWRLRRKTRSLAARRVLHQSNQPDLAEGHANAAA
jgi:hypothetical protein